MNKETDFTTKNQKPTIEEYWTESYKNLVARQNNNPSGYESEDPFIANVIAARATDKSVKLQAKLTHFTAALVITSFLSIIVPSCQKTVSMKEVEKLSVEIESLRQQINALEGLHKKLLQEPTDLNIELNN